MVLPLTACVPAAPGPRSGDRGRTDSAAVSGSSGGPLPLLDGAASPSSMSTPVSHGPASAPPGPTSAPPAQTGSAACERLVTKVGRNHGHAFSVAPSDVLEGLPKAYDLRSDADHTHRIELSAEEFAALGRGEVLRKQSERGGVNAHRHRVLVRCEQLVLSEEMISACEIVVGGKDDHELVIPESHVRAGSERVYDIQGVEGHTHLLTVTAADFRHIAAGKNVDLVSGPGLGHFHHVYIRYRPRV